MGAETRGGGSVKVQFKPGDILLWDGTLESHIRVVIKIHADEGDYELDTGRPGEHTLVSMESAHAFLVKVGRL